MTIISALKTYLKTYTGLKTNSPVWVNYLRELPTDYSIDPLPGERIVETYLDGSSLREYPFAFRSVESTADELERLSSIGFFEAFADWLESQTEAGVLPSLGTGKTAEEIEALGWGFLFQEGESGTGIYQIQCALLYEQE